APSSEHAKPSTGSSASNENEGPVLLLVEPSAGPPVRDTFGGVRSMSHEEVVGLPGLFDASIARTAKSWLPSVSPVYVAVPAGDPLQVASQPTAPSILHSKVAPMSLAVNEKLAVDRLVFGDGNPVSVVSGPFESMKVSIRLFTESATSSRVAVEVGSIAIPSGVENWPVSRPVLPSLDRKVPVGVNSSIRLSSRSVTYRIASVSIATSTGVVNWPSLVPLVPNVRTKLLAESSSCTRLFSESATHTFPDASTASPLGDLNCPPLVPSEPFAHTTAWLGSNISTRLLLVSDT